MRHHLHALFSFPQLRAKKPTRSIPELFVTLRAQGCIREAQWNTLVHKWESFRGSAEEFLYRSGILASRDKEEAMLGILAEQLGLTRCREPELYRVHPAAQNCPQDYWLRHACILALRPDDAPVFLCSEQAGLQCLADVFTLCGVQARPLLASRREISRLVQQSQDRRNPEAENLESEFDADFLEELQSSAEMPQSELLDATSEAPFVRLVNGILSCAVRENASDVHFDPGEEHCVVRFRLDGVLTERFTLPRAVHPPTVSRIKILSRLDISERRLPQDGRFSMTLAGQVCDVRVSCLPTAYGERVTLRLLAKEEKVPDLEELGMFPEDLRLLEELVHISHGIVLVTGPTGSGKTTTLYSILRQIQGPDKNILTIEDPVEYRLDGVGQMQVQEKIGLSFAQGLRSIVRQDPDVILIGEIRDSQTAQIAVQAALTGHLVFSTLHTNDAPSAVTRLVDMGVEPYLVASVLRGVVAQRLVRRLCPQCREAAVPTAQMQAVLGLSPEQSRSAYRAVGCVQCRQTGYHGRRALVEIMPVDAELQRCISRTPDATALREHAVRAGMRSLRDAGRRALAAGLTSPDEVFRVTRNLEDLRCLTAVSAEL